MEPSDQRPRVAAVLLLIALGAPAAFAGGRLEGGRLILEPGGAASVEGDLRGEIEILARPPYDPAKVVLEIDGEIIAVQPRAPYVFHVDLGARRVERRLTITVTAPAKKRLRWSSTINEGWKPLRVRLKKRADGFLEATVTAPPDRNVVAVEFFHDRHLLRSLDGPPWIAEAPPVHNAALIAVARTESGEEASDTLLPGGQQVLASVYEMRTVPLEVSVVDQKGNPVVDLDSARLRILDNGEETKIVSFEKAFHDPVNLTLLLDASNSITMYMPEVSAAARRFVEKTMRPGDRMSVYAIHNVPRRHCPLTASHADVVAAIEAVAPRGNTAIWDSIQTALRELAPQDGRKAIVLLSDGEDTDSMASWDEISRTVRQAGIPLYAIGFGLATEGGAQAERLKWLATESGGFFVLADPERLDQAWDRIERDLRARYAIRYEVFAPVGRSEWRQVRVVLPSAKWTARSIRGYLAH